MVTKWCAGKGGREAPNTRKPGLGSIYQEEGMGGLPLLIPTLAPAPVGLHGLFGAAPVPVRGLHSQADTDASRKRGPFQRTH